MHVQIIQINLALKNHVVQELPSCSVQIIQINLALKNCIHIFYSYALSSNNTNKLSPQERVEHQANGASVQIIQINLALKNCWPYYSTFMLYLQYILSISIIKC